MITIEIEFPCQYEVVGPTTKNVKCQNDNHHCWTYVGPQRIIDNVNTSKDQFKLYPRELSVMTNSGPQTK